MPEAARLLAVMALPGPAPRWPVEAGHPARALRATGPVHPVQGVAVISVEAPDEAGALIDAASDRRA